VGRLKGTWLKIKTADDYCDPEFIEFKNRQMLHFKLGEKNKNGLLDKILTRRENLSESKQKSVDNNRIRIYRMGKTHNWISETESITRDSEFATDYERIKPTKTELSATEIKELELNAEWNDHKFTILFNEELDSPDIKKINKRLNREGRKLVLENLQGTYFASFYDNGKRRTLIGLREIDKIKAVLFGFPETPYQVVAKCININEAQH
jgi:hypothetical protein